MFQVKDLMPLDLLNVDYKSAIQTHSITSLAYLSGQRLGFSERRSPGLG